MAYVLGFFAADGNMIKNNRGAHYIAFYSTDFSIIKTVRNLLRSNHKIALKKLNRPNPRWKDSYQLQIGSKEIFKDLLKLKLTPNKSLTMEMASVPNNQLGHFIRGYFDGDGCVYFKQNWAKDRNKLRWVFQIKFTSGSRQFLKSLHSIIKTLKICKGGFVYSRRDGHELCFSHHDGLALFHFMYDNVPADMYLERKYKTFQKAISTLHLGA